MQVFQPVTVAGDQQQFHWVLVGGIELCEIVEYRNNLGSPAICLDDHERGLETVDDRPDSVGCPGSEPAGHPRAFQTSGELNRESGLADASRSSQDPYCWAI
jgi:hypothetical protein